MREILCKTTSRLIVFFLNEKDGLFVTEILSILSSLLSDEASAVRRAALSAVKSLAKVIYRHINLHFQLKMCFNI